MPDVPLPVPALKGAPAGRLGLQGDESGVRLRALPEGLLLLVPGQITRAALAAAVSQAGLDACLISPAGFEQWLIAADRPASPAQTDALAAALAGQAHLSDQSHGRVRIALSGARSVDVLAKGCGIDSATIEAGSGAMTLFGHLGCHLHRIDAETFHFTVLRSFARALWDELLDAGREYGVEAIAP